MKKQIGIFAGAFVVACALCVGFLSWQRSHVTVPGEASGDTRAYLQALSTGNTLVFLAFLLLPAIVLWFLARNALRGASAAWIKGVAFVAALLVAVAGMSGLGFFSARFLWGGGKAAYLAPFIAFWAFVVLALAYAFQTGSAQRSPLVRAGIVLTGITGFLFNVAVLALYQFHGPYASTLSQGYGAALTEILRVEMFSSCWTLNVVSKAFGWDLVQGTHSGGKPLTDIGEFMATYSSHIKTVTAVCLVLLLVSAGIWLAAWAADKKKQNAEPAN